MGEGRRPRKSDAKLLDAWRRGDKQAGAQLIGRHYKGIVRFFDSKVNAAQDRDDLVQETLRAGVEARDRIKDTSRFEAYLFRIAYNTLKRYLRRKYRVVEDDLSSRSMQDIAPGASTMLQALEQHEQLLSALRELPTNLQTAFELKYWDGLTSSEIAVVMGTRPSTVRSFLSRGRKLLEEKLGDTPMPAVGLPEPV